MPWWNLFALLCAEVLGLLLGWHWNFFRGFLCVCFVLFFLLLSELLHRGAGKASSAWRSWLPGMSKFWSNDCWISQNHCLLETGLFHIRVSCTLVLVKISFIALLPAQLSCVTALRAMERWSSGTKIHIIHYLWNSRSSSKVLVALPFEDF